MKFLKALLFIVCVAFFEYSSAGVKIVGNGGDAVVCYTDATRNKIKSVQMFDYWEQQQVLKLGQVELGAVTLTVQEKISIATKRIAKFDPNLADFINKNALNLADNIQSYTVNSYVLPDIEDANPKVIPSNPNCYIEQFAIQYKDVQSGQRRFYISDKLYNDSVTSNDTKAGLLLHEAIYRYAILKKDIQNSDGVRVYNYVISTARIDQLSNFDLEEYLKYLRLSNLFVEKECTLKGFVYVSDYFHVCYSTALLFNNVQLFIPANTLVSEYSLDFSLPTEWRDNPKNPWFKISVNQLNGKTYEYEVDSIKIYSKSMIEVGNKRSQNDITPKMLGPLGVQYTCERYTIDVNQNELVACWVNYLTNQFRFFSKNVKNNSWFLGTGSYLSTLKSGYELPVLGSKKGLKVQPNYRPYADIGISFYTEVDNNMNLISASTHSESFFTSGDAKYNQPVLNVGQFTYKINAFKVVNKNFNYYLNFISDTFDFTTPKMNGLRIINSSDSRADSFCLDNGYKNGGYITSVASEYIGQKAESFYDLATQNVSYKVDEDVKIVSVIRCRPVAIETDDY